MNYDSRILVAGAKGMVGSAIARCLENRGYSKVIRGTRNFVDFSDQNNTDKFFESEKPEYVFVAAAKVGGIMANNNFKADFLTQNIRIQTNIIESSNRWGAKKLLFLGSSCIYPKFSKQPISEDQLLTGVLEPTNDAYAIAKIAGIMMCKSYRQQYGLNAISLMPSNLYGPQDNFDLETSHVLPAMIAKFHKGKQDGVVSLWGDGSALREFLYVEDLAEACYICMQEYDEEEHINVGTGEDISIKDLASVICDVVGYRGEIIWDASRPNGTPRKVLNIDRIKSLGWLPRTSLRDGIKKTYGWYLNLCV